MLKVLVPLPKTIFVAVSSGVDSMVALDFLARRHDVTALYFDHGDGALEHSVVQAYCTKIGVPLFYGTVLRSKHKDESLEEYWRAERYRFFKSMHDDHIPTDVVTAHHLGDAVETWIWSALNGQPTLPHIRRDHIVRPFLSTPKANLYDWAVRHNVPWMEDPTNLDASKTRNYIRSQMHVFEQINPGLDTMVKKKVIQMAEKLLESVDSIPSDVTLVT